MKIRTCPNCNYQYSFIEYLRKFPFRFIDFKWNCHNCHSELSFNIGRRVILIIIAILPFGIFPFIIRFLNNNGISKGLSWICFIVFMILWSILTYSFDTFSMAKSQKR